MLKTDDRQPSALALEMVVKTTQKTRPKRPGSREASLKRERALSSGKFRRRPVLICKISQISVLGDDRSRGGGVEVSRAEG
jgi:hypothetical protein